MLNQRDAAFDWLDRAVKAGFDKHGDFGWDRDLDNLRSDPRFRKFLDANENARMRQKTSSKVLDVPAVPRTYSW